MALRTCCCGCSVKTGSLIVGYINAVLSGIGVFIFILALIIIGSISKYAADGEEPIRDVLSQTPKEVEFKVSLLGLVVFLKALLVNCLMIHGINRTKPAYVLPWIIFFAAGMVIKTFIGFSAIAFTVNVPSSTWYLITTASALVFLFETYILVVVSSHYHRMKKSSLLDEEQMMM